MIQRIFRYFRGYRLSVLNGVLILLAVLANLYFQVFCVPVLWAGIVFGLCSLAVCLYPLFRMNTRTAIPLAFINGLACCVFLYCIVFLEDMNAWGGMIVWFFGLGFITYIPHLLVIQLGMRYLVRPVSTRILYTFTSGLLVAVLAGTGIAISYRQATTDIHAFEESGYSRLESTYGTERILGMHFKYHTRICIYDGWRPPLHDPWVVIGLWSTGRQDPLEVSLEQRVAWYREFFPERPVLLDCSCAIEYSSMYFNDPLWQMETP